MGETKKYVGSCHCGNVRYEVQADLSSAMECNCSICSRKAAVMSFVPAESFKLLSGESATTDYQFNKKHLHHRFCSTCGIHAHATGKGPDGKEMVMINVRCLDGVDPSKLTLKHYDGRSL